MIEKTLLDCNKVINKKVQLLNKPKEVMIYEQDEFNTYQNLLYKRAIFGISMYTKEEQLVMHLDKRKRIIKVNTHAQKVLNLWKQELLISISNKLLEKYFPNSKIASKIINEFSAPDPLFVNTLDFKSLGINKKLIVNKLISESVLPKNFYQLKEPVIPSINRSGNTLSLL